MAANHAVAAGSIVQASASGARLDSDLLRGGKTDDTVSRNDLLEKINVSTIRAFFKYSGIAISIAAAAAALAVGLNRQASKDLPDVMARLAQYQVEIADLKDRQQIHELYVRWGRAVDRLDEQTYFGVFWPDAQINYGTKESLTPAQHWKGHMLDTYKKNGVNWAHLLTNEAVDIEGDVAHVEIFLTIMAHWKNEKDVRLVAGRYIDRLDRRNGEWRVSVREWMPHFAMKGQPSYDELWKFSFAENDLKIDCVREPRAKWDTSYVRPLERRKTADGPPCAR